MTPDPLDSLFELENTFYNEGYELGVKDGSRAGRIEGRLFGLEKGFEKFTTMGQLHGRSVVWSSRLSLNENRKDFKSLDTQTLDPKEQTSSSQKPPSLSFLPPISPNTRLDKHIRSLYALTEPASLSTDNSEDSVSEIEDRLRRAEGKVKIIERSLIGEGDVGLEEGRGEGREREREGGEGGIEDMNLRGARR